jgi:hypothetical protein
MNDVVALPLELLSLGKDLIGAFGLDVGDAVSKRSHGRGSFRSALPLATMS